ncbi:hypothetical protein [Comamonas sp. CMM02]|uniref:hypothetical protein n=1 Tax=Comamonas sp. CMM02 TaxID=2769307 RepID=UPI001783606E|nr:hypothetical protein [Comamonas sp. CMM02]MBD9402272.1 hypothetical protein [Comamonas sp. CMM02]
MKRRIVCTVAAALLLSGCLLEGAAPVERNPKPDSAYWIKEGVTKESRLADWIQCGGRTNGNYGYEIQKGQSHKEFFEGFNAYTNQVRACMRNLGYTRLQECDARCL